MGCRQKPFLIQSRMRRGIYVATLASEVQGSGISLASFCLFCSVCTLQQMQKHCGNVEPLFWSTDCCPPVERSCSVLVRKKVICNTSLVLVKRKINCNVDRNLNTTGPTILQYKKISLSTTWQKALMSWHSKCDTKVVIALKKQPEASVQLARKGASVCLLTAHLSLASLGCFFLADVCCIIFWPVESINVHAVFVCAMGTEQS